MPVVNSIVSHSDPSVILAVIIIFFNSSRWHWAAAIAFFRQFSLFLLLFYIFCFKFSLDPDDVICQLCSLTTYMLLKRNYCLSSNLYNCYSFIRI